MNLDKEKYSDLSQELDDLYTMEGEDALSAMLGLDEESFDDLVNETAILCRLHPDDDRCEVIQEIIERYTREISPVIQFS